MEGLKQRTLSRADIIGKGNRIAAKVYNPTGTHYETIEKFEDFDDIKDDEREAIFLGNFDYLLENLSRSADELNALNICIHGDQYYLSREVGGQDKKLFKVNKTFMDKIKEVFDVEIHEDESHTDRDQNITANSVQFRLRIQQ